MNDQLRNTYSAVWKRLSALVVLQAPDFDVVHAWRCEQEECLRQCHAPHAMDDAALSRFIAHYERLSRHALTTLPDYADLCVWLDARRAILKTTPEQ